MSVTAKFGIHWPTCLLTDMHSHCPRGGMCSIPVFGLERRREAPTWRHAGTAIAMCQRSKKDHCTQFERQLPDIDKETLFKNLPNFLKIDPSVVPARRGKWRERESSILSDALTAVNLSTSTQLALPERAGLSRTFLLHFF